MDPYELKNLIPGPTQSLYEPDDNEGFFNKYTLNWMLMVKENIDAGMNTVTLPNDTVVRYTGGCILSEKDHTNILLCIYTYLKVTNVHRTLIITNRTDEWVDKNRSHFRFNKVTFFKNDHEHVFMYGDEHTDHINSMNILIVSPQLFDMAPNASDHKKIVLSKLINIQWTNLIIDTPVQSNLINCVDANYKWVLLDEELLSHRYIHNALSICVPNQYKLYAIYYDYLIRAVFINSLWNMTISLRSSKADVIYCATTHTVEILDPLQNSECEVKGGTDEECCICSYNYNDTDRVRITLPCGHQFCAGCLGKQRNPCIDCYFCRQHCNLLYISSNQAKSGIAARVNNYIHAIYDHPMPYKSLLCIDDPHYMNPIYNALEANINVILLNKALVTVKDIAAFRASTAILLIIPYKVKFELGVDLLFVQQATIICSPKNEQRYNYLMSFLMQRSLRNRYIQVFDITIE